MESSTEVIEVLKAIDLAKKSMKELKKNESFSIKQPTCRVIGRKEIHI